MAMTYEEARKIAEDRKYGVTGSIDNIDEGYIKAIQNSTLQDYTNKIASATRQSAPSYTPSYAPSQRYTPLSQQDAYQRASNVINPQMQQLKNNLILKLSQQRQNNVSNLASRGQAVGGQRELAEANISSEEALQGSNIMLQGDISKNQLAEQYLADARAEQQRQEALDYQQYMDSINQQNANRQFGLQQDQFGWSKEQAIIDQQNIEAEREFREKEAVIQNAVNQGYLTIAQGDSELSNAKFEWEKKTYTPPSYGGGSSAPQGMTDQEIKLEAIKRATDSSGYFDQATYNRIYRLLSGGTPTSDTAPVLTTPIRSVLLNNMYNLGKPATTPVSTTKKSDIPPLEW